MVRDGLYTNFQTLNYFLAKKKKKLIKMHTEMLKNWHQRLIYFHCIILYKKNSIKVRLYAQKIRLKSGKKKIIIIN